MANPKNMNSVTTPSNSLIVSAESVICAKCPEVTHKIVVTDPLHAEVRQRLAQYGELALIASHC